MGRLETDAIGGTWGKATSVLAAGIQAKNATVRDLLRPYHRGIHASGDLMAHYVTKYFNDIYDHAEQVAKVCARAAASPTSSATASSTTTPCRATRLLAAIFQHFGFTLDRIDKMRKRQSKTGLYEAVVFMRR